MCSRGTLENITLMEGIPYLKLPLMRYSFIKPISNHPTVNPLLAERWISNTRIVDGSSRAEGFKYKSYMEASRAEGEEH